MIPLGNQYSILLYFIKELYNLDLKIEEVRALHCFISEITLAELKFGIANSQTKKKNQAVLENFLSGIQILPIFPALDMYAEEKAVFVSQARLLTILICLSVQLLSL